MTAGEERELYLLWRHFGMRPEVVDGLPEWQISLLLRQLDADLQKGGG